MNKLRPSILLAALAFGAGAPLVPLPARAADDGTTGSGTLLYLTGTTVWTEDHRYDSGGNETSLNVGTGAGEGHLSVQNGARVEVPSALFIAGKGYGSSYSIEEGHDGLVTVGPGSTLECGTLTSSASGGHVYVGWGSGVTGTLRVDGGELITNYMLHVGCHEESNGLLEVQNGGRVTIGLGENIGDADAGFLSIATAEGSEGLLRVSGGSTLAFDVAAGERTRADVGTGGKGTLLVEEGSYVSLGQDYALIGVESGSRGLAHVRGGSMLALPGMTIIAQEEDSLGELLVEGQGSRLTGQDVIVGEAGDAIITLQDNATAEISGNMWVGANTGTGQLCILSGAQLANAGETVVGGQGSIRIEDGGRWVSAAPVRVEDGGQVSVQGSGRWAVQGGASFESGSTLSLAVLSAERVPEVSVAEGEVLTMSAGSRLQLTLSADLVAAAAAGGLELTLIQGDFVGEDYEYELLDTSGLFDTSDLTQLADGQWGLSVTLDREGLQRSLADDASRLANGLWSSTGTVQDYATALLNRPGCARRNHVWGMGLGSFSHMGGQGFNFSGGGYALGADAAVQCGTTLGLSFGQIYGTHKSSDHQTRIRQNSLMGSLYARYDSQAGAEGRRLVLDAYATYGRVRNGAHSSMFANGVERSTGHWWDDVYALGLRATWELPLTEHSSLLPFIGLRYVHGSHGALTMSSDERERGYSSARLHNLSLPVGFTLRGRYRFCRAQEFLPELTLAYVGDLSRNNPHMSTDMLGESTRSRGASPGRNAFMLRTGAAWVINEHWTTGLYYNLECRSHEVDQAVDMSVSYGF